MNTQNIETQKLQENAHEQNLKIAQIYQKMLQGDKSALSNLQKIKIPSQKLPYQKLFNKNPHEQLDLEDTSKNMKINHKKFNNNKDQIAKSSSYQAVDSNSISLSDVEDDKQKLMRIKNENQKNKEKLRNYIKKKVNELKNERQYLKNQEQQDLKSVKKIASRTNIASISQSKSFEITKHNNLSVPKQIINRNAIKKVENKGEDKSNVIKKAQSSLQHKAYKYFPLINEKKKIPTQIAQSQLQQSAVLKRQDVSTPINLAKSKMSIIKNHMKEKSIVEMQKNQPADQNKIKNIKNQNIKIKKIPLPQIRRQREQFAKINQEEKTIQFDVINYHQKTKQFLEDIKRKNQINFRNQNILPKRNKVETNTDDEGNPSPKKKKVFDVIEQLIKQNYEDISQIDLMIKDKRLQMEKNQRKLSKNLLMQFWQQHDIYNDQFSEDQIEQEITQSMTQSKFLEAYSTVMPKSKSKNWRNSKIKKYDTNRSYQEYEKSRTKYNQSRTNEKSKISLNRIEENQDQLEQSMSNKITVNDRLKKLLLS